MYTQSIIQVYKMNVSVQLNNQKPYQPNFNRLLLIQASKDAFSNPKNLEEVSDVFKSNLEAAANSHKNPFFRVLDKIFGNSQIISYLEQPKYVDLWKGLKGQGGDMDWLSQNLNVKIKKPLDENYHSFYVYTDIEAIAAMYSLHQKNVSMLEDAYKKDFDKGVEVFDKVMGRKRVINNPSWITAKMNRHLFRDLKTLHENSEIENFKINDLSQLYEIFK